MRAHQRIEIGFLHPRLRAVGGKTVDDAVLVPPVAREELPGDAALVARGAVGIVQSVVGAKARERRRRDDAYPPLRHAAVRLAEAADLAVRPGLRRNPLAHILDIVLLIP